KTRASRRGFARNENAPSDSTSGEIRMNKKSTDARRVASRIQFRVFTRSPAIAAVHRLTFAPAAAADGGPVVFDDKIRSVANQLAIDAEHRSERSGHLHGRIVCGLQRANGEGNQIFERRDVGFARETWVPIHEWVEL